MSIMKSKFKYMYDAAPSVSLVANDKVAKTATFTGSTVVLDTLEGYWTNGELADQTFSVIINVTDVDKTTGDENYVLALEAGPASFATSLEVGKVTVNGPGQYIILVDADTVRAQKADASAIRIKGTLAGTTPSIKLFAWMAGIQK